MFLEIAASVSDVKQQIKPGVGAHTCNLNTRGRRNRSSKSSLATEFKANQGDRKQARLKNQNKTQHTANHYHSNEVMSSLSLSDSVWLRRGVQTLRCVS